MFYTHCGSGLKIEKYLEIKAVLILDKDCRLCGISRFIMKNMWDAGTCRVLQLDYAVNQHHQMANLLHNPI